MGAPFAAPARRSRLALGAVLLCGLLAGGCSDELGAGEPACDLAPEEASVALVTQAQAVPGARWGPCINDLPLGWSLRLMTPESGRAGFWLDSDRVGFGFAEVALVDSCSPPRDARSLPGAPPGLRRMIDVEQRPVPLPITIVPVSSRHEETAFALAQDLADERIEGHPVSVRQTSVEGEVVQRILAARQAGRFVVVVDDSALEGEFEVWYPDDDDPDTGVDFEDLLDELEELAADPVLRATWWDVGDDACTVIEIDAEGQNAGAVITDLTSAVGAYPLSALHELAEDQGVVLGEEWG